MRVVVTGGAGFIGRALVKRLSARGDDVVALVRDPTKARHIAGERVTLIASDLGSANALRIQVRAADGLIHAAGSYRIGIRARDRAPMWEANVGASERVMDAAIAEGVPRIVYVSTNNVFGNTNGEIVDEAHERDLRTGFLSWYDETKYRAHEAVLKRIAAGAPIVIVQPGQTYGPNDHSDASAQLATAHAGRLRYVVFPTTGLAWVHVDDLADAIVAALDRGRAGETYSLAGDPKTMAQAIATAARIGGNPPPRIGVPTRLLRAIAPINDRLGGLMGLPSNLSETITAADGVTYWARHDKATAELGFSPRSLEQGIVDTWGRGRKDR